MARSLDGSTTQEEAYSSSFERSISMFRSVDNGQLVGLTSSQSNLSGQILLILLLLLLLLLLFLTFSVLVANPKKLLYTVANPARGLLDREKGTK